MCKYNPIKHCTHTQAYSCTKTHPISTCNGMYHLHGHSCCIVCATSPIIFVCACTCTIPSFNHYQHFSFCTVSTCLYSMPYPHLTFLTLMNVPHHQMHSHHFTLKYTPTHHSTILHAVEGWRGLLTWHRHFMLMLMVFFLDFIFTFIFSYCFTLSYHWWSNFRVAEC